MQEPPFLIHEKPKLVYAHKLQAVMYGHPEIVFLKPHPVHDWIVLQPEQVTHLCKYLGIGRDADKKIIYLQPIPFNA